MRTSVSLIESSLAYDSWLGSVEFFLVLFTSIDKHDYSQRFIIDNGKCEHQWVERYTQTFTCVEYSLSVSRWWSQSNVRGNDHWKKATHVITPVFFPFRSNSVKLWIRKSSSTNEDPRYLMSRSLCHTDVFLLFLGLRFCDIRLVWRRWCCSREITWRRGRRTQDRGRSIAADWKRWWHSMMLNYWQESDHEWICKLICLLLALFLLLRLPFAKQSRR